MNGQSRPLERVLDVIIRQTRARPPVNQRVDGPDNKKRKHAREDDDGQNEIRHRSITRIAAIPVPSASAAPMPERATAVAPTLPVRPSKCARHVAGHKCTIDGNRRVIPPRNKLIMATELRHIDGRAAPVVLEKHIDQQPGAKIMVLIRKTTARPGMNSLRRGRISLTSSASTAGITSTVPTQRPRLAPSSPAVNGKQTYCDLRPRRIEVTRDA